MSRVFLTRKIYAEALKQIPSEVEVEVWQTDSPPPQEVLLQKAAEVDGLLTLLCDPINTAVIKTGAENHLKVISQLAVGFDNIDVKASTSCGIPVGHTPGVLTETTADFAWALLMAAARRVVEAHNEVHQGIWRPWDPAVLCGADVYGATIGLVGFGRIGQAMARRAKGFNMTILYTQRHRDPAAEKELGAEYLPLDELLKRSDYVSLHAYLSPEAKGMIGAKQFTLMKPGAIFVNTARGAMVDHDALNQALKSGKLAAAALDVFDPEPIPRDSPLLCLPQVLITPHIASASTKTRQRMAFMTVENLLAGLSGKRLPYCANPEVYEDKS
jgi:glyoxylate reductase